MERICRSLADIDRLFSQELEEGRVREVDSAQDQEEMAIPRPSRKGKDKGKGKGREASQPMVSRPRVAPRQQAATPGPSNSQPRESGWY